MQEEEDYDEVVATTPKRGTPTGSSSAKRHFGPTDAEFSSIGDREAGAGAAPSSATKSFLKRFSFTGAK